MTINSMKDAVEIKVTKADLISAIQKMMQANARFTTVTCIDRKDQTELIYHFADADNSGLLERSELQPTIVGSKSFLQLPYYRLNLICDIVPE